jgi:hypothetical protein
LFPKTGRRFSMQTLDTVVNWYKSIVEILKRTTNMNRNSVKRSVDVTADVIVIFACRNIFSSKIWGKYHFITSVSKHIAHEMSPWIFLVLHYFGLKYCLHIVRLMHLMWSFWRVFWSSTTKGFVIWWTWRFLLIQVFLLFLSYGYTFQNEI